jgi:5-carboxymethyl-2-hydroxymuconate isomerase
MPHITVEYSANIAPEADISGLLAKINATLMAQDGVFPTGGIRSRAIAYTDYRVADGAADDAFVHVTARIGAGRDDATKKRAFDALFDVVKSHFAPLYGRRYLALSMETAEWSEAGTYKHNNIHARFPKA